jgi:hypothetical protein
MMQTDVKAAHIDASGVIFAGPTRVRGYQISPGGTAGELQFYDNATTNSGRIPMTLQITTATTMFSGVIPGEGVRFDNGVYVVLPLNASLTVFYG